MVRVSTAPLRFSRVARPHMVQLPLVEIVFFNKWSGEQEAGMAKG